MVWSARVPRTSAVTPTSSEATVSAGYAQRGTSIGALVCVWFALDAMLAPPCLILTRRHISLYAHSAFIVAHRGKVTPPPAPPPRGEGSQSRCERGSPSPVGEGVR